MSSFVGFNSFIRNSTSSGRVSKLQPTAILANPILERVELWGTVEKKIESASRTSMVTALAPICADKFERAAKADNDLVVKLNAVSSWQRDDHLMKAGWTTFPGRTEPDRDVASACATLLNTALKLK